MVATGTSGYTRSVCPSDVVRGNGFVARVIYWHGSADPTSAGTLVGSHLIALPERCVRVQ